MTASPTIPALTTEERALFETLGPLMMKIARPFVWHDVAVPWPKKLRGGTCFILRFRSGPVLVTANHVIKAFEQDKNRGSKVEMLLRGILFDVESAAIDRDEELDLATFKITEQQIVESEAIAVDCQGAWPPPRPARGNALSFAGYPEVLKASYPHDRLQFNAFVHFPRVEDVSEAYVVATYVQGRDVRIVAAPNIRDAGVNWSGCSGGPVLLHLEVNGIWRWFPAGIIMEGPKKDTNPDAAQDMDIFRFKRIDFLNSDGSIRRASSGWLPST